MSHTQTSLAHASFVALFVSLGAIGTAQAQLPDGFVLYEGHKSEFTIALPEGWTVYDQAASLGGSPSPLGSLIFTSSNPKELGVDKQVEAMLKLDRGELPSFRVSRSSVKLGATCASFPEKAQKRVVKIIQRGLPGSNVAPPQVEAVTIGGCQGLRVRMDLRERDGTEWLADVRAVTNGNTLYLFSLRNPKENFEKNREQFEKSMSTVQLASATP